MEGNGGREALIEALSNELGVDADPEFERRVDRILVGLFLLGFVVKPVEEVE